MLYSIDTIKADFRSKHIQLSDDFLTQCLEWIASSFPNASSDEKSNIIYEEWLNLDLQDVQLPILPPNCNEAIEMTLDQPMFLQLLYVVDISKPKYLQLKSIRSKFDDHTEDIESSGMLKLQLTDGVQEISAIEYKKVSCLNLNLAPGLKVCLIPPINIRRGQILLEPHMIVLHGGCVPEIAVSNCVENVLAAALNQPLTDTPRNGETNSALVPQVVPITLPQASDTPRPSVTSIPARQAIAEVEDPFEDIIPDDVFNHHFEALECNTVDLERSKSPCPAVIEDAFADMPEAEALNSFSPIPLTRAPSAITLSSDSGSVVITPIKKPIIKIAKLNQIKHKVTKGIFTIEMEISEIRQRMRVEDKAYVLRVLAVDESGEIEVQMANDVIRDLMEIEAEEFLDLHMIGDTVQTTKIMQNLTEKINSFCAKVVVKVEAGKCPMVTEVLENNPIS